MATNFGDLQLGAYAEAVKGVNTRYSFDFQSIECKALTVARSGDAVEVLRNNDEPPAGFRRGSGRRRPARPD